MRILFILVAFGLAGARAAAQFAIGADVSFLKQAEDGGTVFKDGGEAKAGLRIFREHGYNWVRLRLFHTPTQLPNNLKYTVQSAQAAKRLGYRFLLDLHYSDTWADPGKQNIPKAWLGLDHQKLVEAVFEYTRDTMRSFDQAGVLPDMVQIGNEVSNGMLWPDGKLPGRWDEFADLVRAGVRGVQEGAPEFRRPRIMIHIDKGGSVEATRAFFDRFRSYLIPFDVIGQSFYPWWHGSLLNLKDNLVFMSDTYRQDIILVEVAYNHVPGEYTQRPGPFPESAEGQRVFLDEVSRLVMETPGGRGKGVFWWEPAVTGGLMRRGMFDWEHNGLPALTVFDKWTRH